MNDGVTVNAVNEMESSDSALKFYNKNNVPEELNKYLTLLLSLAAPESIVTIARSLSLFGTFSLRLDSICESEFRPVYSRLFGKINVVKFDNYKESLYIFQSRASCDALFIPEFSAVIAIRYCTEGQSNRIIPYILEHDAKYSKMTSNLFIGFMAKSDRPSHFFYNV